MDRTDLMEPAGRPYDGERFRRLALYFASRSRDDRAFGKTKLVKLLFYSDFFAYGELGASITGATYLKFPHGPYPECIDEEINCIVQIGDGVVENARYFGKEQRRLIALQSVNIDIFSGPEISIAEQVLEALRDQDAAGVSRLSHLEPAWQFVNDRDTIPYELVFVSPEPPGEDLIRAGQEVAERLGLVSRAQ